MVQALGIRRVGQGWTRVGFALLYHVAAKDGRAMSARIGKGAYLIVTICPASCLLLDDHTAGARFGLDVQLTTAGLSLTGLCFAFPWPVAIRMYS